MCNSKNCKSEVTLEMIKDMEEQIKKDAVDSCSIDMIKDLMAKHVECSKSIRNVILKYVDSISIEMCNDVKEYIQTTTFDKLKRFVDSLPKVNLDYISNLKPNQKFKFRYDSDEVYTILSIKVMDDNSRYFKVNCIDSSYFNMVFAVPEDVEVIIL